MFYRSCGKTLQTGSRACRGGEKKTGVEETAGTLGQQGQAGGGEGEELQKQEEGAELQVQRRAAVLLFEADVAEVSVVDADDAVVLLEEALLLRLASPLQTLDQQAQSPERAREAREPWRRLGSGTASTRSPLHPCSRWERANAPARRELDVLKVSVERAAGRRRLWLCQEQEENPSIHTQKHQAATPGAEAEPLAATR